MDDGAARPLRWRKAVAVLVALLLLALLGLWSQRKPIARNVVDAELRARGVPARYTIAALGPGMQRLTNVVIGDPAAPDLVADEVVLRLRYGFGWPTVAAVEGRGVRLRGRVVDGRVSFGAIDRLLPPPTGAPFTLPDIRLALDNAHILLATPAGAVNIDVRGRGRLTDGFEGRLAVRVPELTSGDCRAADVSADMAVRIADRRPRLSGPLVASGLACAGANAAQPRFVLDTTLEESLDPRVVALSLATSRVAAGREGASALRGRLTYDARDPRNRHGILALIAENIDSRFGTARTMRWQGPFRLGGRVGDTNVRLVRVGGEVAVTGANLRASRAASAYARVLAGSPLAPVGESIAQAVFTAGRDVDFSARVSLDGDLGGKGRTIDGEVRVSDARLASRSGGRATFAGDGVRIDLARRTLRVAGEAAIGGGRLPTARVTLRQPSPDAPLTGVATFLPYTADGSRLALAPARFTHAADLRLETVATIDGPLGDGRVRGLTLPLSGRVGREVVVNAACVPLSFTSLSIAGMDLGRTRLPLCPVGGAMLRVANGRVSGGMAVPRPRLEGRVGAQPLTIAAADLRVDVARPGFTSRSLAVRLGGEGGTRLDVARLNGRTDRGGVGGRFGGAAGQIANVPLLLSGGVGDWRLAGGRLTLKAAATVSDADASPRFRPLVAPDIALDLTAGVIGVSGTLREPRSNLAISNVAIRHDLRNGAGSVTLDVPGITFGPAFQPEAITPLTLGIVANVVGTVNGQGRIAWSRAGVTSSGNFATKNLDLAAAFGPVTGISTEIHFSDLLALETPPGQLVTVAAFNPGIAVEGGIVGYQLLAGQKVAVGGGKWPFSGGSLILEPTVLDFGQPVARRMTFRVEGLDAAKFLERFDFKNIAATGLFDGSLPMVFDQSGGRITGGRLVVRPPGGTLAYVGELTNKDLGLFGKLAFDALKSIRYSNLAIELDGALDSEIVSRIVFTGTNENPREKKPTGLLKNLTGLPFRFNIVIRAPFRGLTSSAEAFVNPRGLLGGAVQPAEPSGEASPPVKPPLSLDER